jgi:hypothetical protein
VCDQSTITAEPNLTTARAEVNGWMLVQRKRLPVFQRVEKGFGPLRELCLVTAHSWERAGITGWAVAPKSWHEPVEMVGGPRGRAGRDKQMLLIRWGSSDSKVESSFSMAGFWYCVTCRMPLIGLPCSSCDRDGADGGVVGQRWFVLRREC